MLYERSAAWRISAAYGLIGIMWVTMSNSFVQSLPVEAPVIIVLELIIDYGFVIVSAASLLYFIHYEYETRHQIKHQLRDTRSDLYHTQNRLKAREDDMALVLNTVNDMVWLMDIEQNKPIFINQSALKTFGFSPSRFYEDVDVWMRAVHPDDRAHYMQARLTLTETGTRDLTYRIISPDGTVRHVHDRAWAIYDDAGQLTRIVGVFSDVSERVRLQQYRRDSEKTQQRLKKALELRNLREQLVSMINHEFRNPLTTIHTSAQMLTRYIDRLTDDRRLDHLGRIDTAVKHLTTLLNEMMHTFKEDLTNDVEFGRVDVQTLCETCLDDVRYTAPENIQFEWVCNVSPRKNKTATISPLAAISASSTMPDTAAQDAYTQAVFIEADERLLKRVLTNLLSNAVKYSPDGGCVHVMLDSDNKGVTLTIRDEGIGIPADEIPDLFKKFKRASNTGNISGTGLGLVISKQAIDLHNGTIDVHSVEGVGTTFTLRLPRQQPVMAPLQLQAVV